MDELLELWNRPKATEVYMLAGWRQWADAGAVSSALPQYLIDQLGATQIGRIKSTPFYIYQLPGMHGFLRPEIKLEDGYVTKLQLHHNDVYYWESGQQGLVIFLGDEPNLDIDRYGQALFNLAKELNVRRVVALGGVYAAVPFDKDRSISCTYSLPKMKEELNDYAVRFSHYEGGASIPSYLAHQAEQMQVEYIAFYAMVPMYDFSSIAPNLQAITVEQDWKAWYDVMARINHMFRLGISLSDLERQSEELVTTVRGKLKELEERIPQAKIDEYLDKVTQSFAEMPFMPLDDVWEKGLGDLLQGMGE